MSGNYLTAELANVDEEQINEELNQVRRDVWRTHFANINREN